MPRRPDELGTGSNNGRPFSNLIDLPRAG
jgi:hypothetical protein